MTLVAFAVTAIALFFVALSAAEPLAGSASSWPAFNQTRAFETVFYAAASYCLAYLKTDQWTCRACRFNPGMQLVKLLHGCVLAGRGRACRAAHALRAGNRTRGAWWASIQLSSRWWWHSKARGPPASRTGAHCSSDFGESVALTRAPRRIADLSDDLVPYAAPNAPSNVHVHKGFWGAAMRRSWHFAATHVCTSVVHVDAH